ncbi:ABC transporter ATP-binding protein [Methylocella tundrae]|uniref:ABC transporter ATP-binding protein n=1 Tax=Methylocella tundrae TaxID=227605 RepID=A0A8B6M8N0_METTU|nr:ABC transporter ATP-binding protein [Methylocella tundrae]
MSILVADSLSRSFGAVNVIDRLDLRLDAGEILGIIGPNGAGKTTFFNLIAGVMRPSGGSICFEGRDITGLATWDRCRLGIGRTYQVPKPYAHMSVYENVLVAAVHGGGLPLRDAHNEVEGALDLTGLSHAHAIPSGQLTLLDLKRLELCRALSIRPRLLLLDEIAGGLTDAESHVLLDIIRHVHARGAAIIWIEHVIHALRRLATRLVVLYSGNFVVDGTPEEVLADARAKSIYLGE